MDSKNSQGMASDQVVATLLREHMEPLLLVSMFTPAIIFTTISYTHTCMGAW